MGWKALCTTHAGAMGLPNADIEICLFTAERKDLSEEKHDGGGVPSRLDPIPNLGARL